MNQIILNEKQELTIHQINRFMDDEYHKEFYLLGYAGTGKTFLICHTIKNLLAQNKITEVFVCAPTHQALNVIESYFKSRLTPTELIEFASKVKFATIHKLLGFRPIISNETGDKTFKFAKETNFFKKNNKKLIIIDECSMIPQNMVSSLNEYSDKYHLKIIYLGDNAQLPPVEEKESQIFENIPKNYPYHVVLDEIMRTSSNEIKKIAHAIRTWNQTELLDQSIKEIYHNQTNKKFKLYHKKTNYLEATWFKNFINNLKLGQSSIILTWKNNTSDYYNQIIRNYIHQSNNQNNYQIGDIIMFQNFYTLPDQHIYFYTSDMARIIEVNNKKSSLIDWDKFMAPSNSTSLLNKAYNRLIKKLSKTSTKMKVSTLKINKICSSINNSNNGQTVIIKTIHRDDLDKYQELRNNVQEHIGFFFKKYKSDLHTANLWKLYHKELVDQYADLNFGYSITTHKAQGSTFKSVLVDISDVFENPDRSELKKMLYTATTRSSHELGFLLM